jgi:hypothetical protein
MIDLNLLNYQISKELTISIQEKEWGEEVL